MRYKVSAGIPLVLVALVVGVAILVTSAQGEPEREAVEPAPTFVPGLPIDTPPAEPGLVLDSPAAEEAGAWLSVADTAYHACTSFGLPNDKTPDAMYRTTAGEVRRRISEAGLGVTGALGSPWGNDDDLYIVGFRGDYNYRPAPPVSNEDTGRLEEPKAIKQKPDICVYYGDGTEKAQWGTFIVGDKNLSVDVLILADK